MRGGKSEDDDETITNTDKNHDTHIWHRILCHYDWRNRYYRKNPRHTGRRAWQAGDDYCPNDSTASRSETIHTEKEGWNEIEPAVEKIRVINEADYIVAMNMDHVRYSHPVKDMLGTKSEGSDEGAAFADHTFISKAKGEMGTAVRAFVPIKNDNLEQIGVVTVGHVIPGFNEVVHDLMDEMTLIFYSSFHSG